MKPGIYSSYLDICGRRSYVKVIGPSSTPGFLLIIENNREGEILIDYLVFNYHYFKKNNCLLSALFLGSEAFFDKGEKE